MTGLRPVAEIMFSDFGLLLGLCGQRDPQDAVLIGGQVTVPLVVRTANGGGLGFGAQHSQAVENWAFAVPGLKIAAPDPVRLRDGPMAAAIRSDDPVLVFEHKSLLPPRATRHPRRPRAPSAPPRSAVPEATSPWSPWPRPSPPPWPRRRSWPPTGSTPR